MAWRVKAWSHTADIEPGASTDYLHHMKLTLPLALTLAAALAISGCQKTEDAAFGAKVRAYLLAHPEVLREVITV